MSPCTIFLAKLLGLFIIILAVGIVANHDGTAIAFLKLLRDPDVLWVTGMVGVAAGLAVMGFKASSAVVDDPSNGR